VIEAEMGGERTQVEIDAGRDQNQPVPLLAVPGDSLPPSRQDPWGEPDSQELVEEVASLGRRNMPQGSERQLFEPAPGENPCDEQRRGRGEYQQIPRGHRVTPKREPEKMEQGIAVNQRPVEIEQGGRSPGAAGKTGVGHRGKTSGRRPRAWACGRGSAASRAGILAYVGEASGDWA
jgi:hypothetical protein